LRGPESRQLAPITSAAVPILVAAGRRPHVNPLPGPEFFSL
jgi:hypothetical protein